MDLNRFTVQVQEAFSAAQRKAGERGHSQIEGIHLFLAFAQNPEGILSAILKKSEINPGMIIADFEREIERLPRISGGVSASKVYLSDELNRVVTQAEKEAQAFKDEYVSAEHVLLAALDPSLQKIDCPPQPQRSPAFQCQSAPDEVVTVVGCRQYQ